MLENKKPEYVPPQAFGVTLTPSASDIIAGQNTAAEFQVQKLKDLDYPSLINKYNNKYGITSKEYSRYPEGVTRESVLLPRWSKTELGILYFRVNKDSIATTSERTLANAVLKLPDRTESAIYSKILELGGHVTHGVICKT